MEGEGVAGEEGDAPDDGSCVVADQAPGREGTGQTFDGVDTGGWGGTAQHRSRGSC